MSGSTSNVFRFLKVPAIIFKELEQMHLTVASFPLLDLIKCALHKNDKKMIISYGI